MLVAAALVSAIVTAGPEPVRVHPVVGGMVRASQPQGRMYPIHRTMGYQFTQNGRPWVSRGIIGPEYQRSHRSCEVPGPSVYGAPEWDHQRIAVRVGQQVIFISPWQRIEMPGLHWLERERILWLKAHNYASGVRTFRNDAYDVPEPMHRPVREHAAPLMPPAPRDGGMLEGEEEVVTMRGTPAPARIEPRATIRLPDDAPRFRAKMRVMAPRVNAVIATGEARDGVTTVRGEWSNGTVIRVLPVAKQPALAKTDDAASKPGVRAQVAAPTKAAAKDGKKPEQAESAPEQVASADK
jgi:hypothetical protein